MSLKFAFFVSKKTYLNINVIEKNKYKCLQPTIISRV